MAREDEFTKLIFKCYLAFLAKVAFLMAANIERAQALAANIAAKPVQKLFKRVRKGVQKG